MTRPANSKLIKKRLKEKIRKIFYFYFIPFLAFFVFLVFVFNLKNFQIKEIIFQNKISPEEKNKLTTFIENELDKKYLNLFSKRNYIFYPKDTLISKIEKNFLDYEKVNLSLLNKKIYLKFHKREESFLYKKNDTYFSVVEDGFIYSQLDNKKEKEKIIFVLEDEKRIGDYIFESPEEKKKIINFSKRLNKNFDISVNEVKINNFSYKFILKNGLEFKVKKTDNLDNTIIQLKKLLRQTEIEFVKNEKNIKYISVVKNRVKICYQGEVCAKSN